MAYVCQFKKKLSKIFINNAPVNFLERIVQRPLREYSNFMFFGIVQEFLYIKIGNRFKCIQFS